MLKLFARGMVFGAGMPVVSMTGSMIWSGWIVARWRETTQHLVPDTSRAGIRASLQQEVDAYNARLAQLSTPDVTAMGRTLTAETLTTRDMMHRFVAPGGTAGARRAPAQPHGAGGLQPRPARSAARRLPLRLQPRRPRRRRDPHRHRAHGLLGRAGQPGGA